MTQYLHRLLFVVPVARVAAVVSWLNTNIGANTVPETLGPGLSPTGDEPFTHHWCCGSFTDSECREILRRLCQLASVTPPTVATWNGWTGQQKRTWLASVRDAVYAGWGVWVQLADNVGQWDDPQACLTSRRLQTKRAELQVMEIIKQ